MLNCDLNWQHSLIHDQLFQCETVQEYKNVSQCLKYSEMPSFVHILYRINMLRLIFDPKHLPFFSCCFEEISPIRNTSQ